MVSDKLKERMGNMLLLGKTKEGFEVFILKSRLIGFEIQPKRVVLFIANGGAISYSKDKFEEEEYTRMLGILREVA